MKTDRRNGESEVNGLTEKQFDNAVERILDGNRSGLRDIYEEYGRMIFGTVMSVVKSPHDAEDITSDFFIRLWSIADTYVGGNGHRRWLAAIARNMAIDHLRRKKRETVADEDSCFEETPSDEHLEDSVTDRLTVTAAVEALEETEREIINLKFISQLTFSEISKILKKPLGTVTWKYRKALEKLRRCIPDEKLV